MKVSIKKLLSWIFTLSLVLFMLMGIGIVLVQAVALVTANGALSIAAVGTPEINRHSAFSHCGICRLHLLVL